MLAHAGVSLTASIVMMVNLLILIAWPVLSIIGLVSLRKRRLPPTATAIWALVIIVIPLLGAIGYWIVQPKAENR